MKTRILAACGVVALATTMTAAHAPPAPTQTVPGTPVMQPMATPKPGDTVVTVTGCLKAWDSTMGASPPGAERYVLTDGDGTVAPPETSRPATAPRSTLGLDGHPTQYVLAAETAVNLAPHLNHTVQITGKTSMLVDPAAKPAARMEPARPGDPVPAAEAGGGGVWTLLTASSLTMVAANCGT